METGQLISKNPDSTKLNFWFDWEGMTILLHGAPEAAACKNKLKDSNSRLFTVWYLFLFLHKRFRNMFTEMCDEKNEVSTVAGKSLKVMRLKVFADMNPLWEIQWGLPERLKKLSVLHQNLTTSRQQWNKKNVIKSSFCWIFFYLNIQNYTQKDPI